MVCTLFISGTYTGVYATEIGGTVAQEKEYEQVCITEIKDIIATEDIVVSDNTEIVEVTDIITTEEVQDIRNFDDLLEVEAIEISSDEIDGEVYEADELLAVAENMPSFMSDSYGLYWDNYTSYYIYNQLSADKQKLWSALEVLCSGYLANEADIKNSKTDYVSITNSEITKNDLKSLMELFKYTHPQYYYITGGYYYSVSGTKIGIALMVYDAFADGVDRKNATNAIKLQLDEWCEEIALGANEEEKVKIIHDIICNKVVYNRAAVNEGLENDYVEQSQFTQSAYSVFCMDKTVCAGYTQAFMWLCNAVDIECFGVTSATHGWNKVKVNDNWYNVDVTWADNDNGQIDYYDYLKNDDYMNSRNSHKVKKMWEPYMPSCTLDSGSTHYVGELPVVTRKVATPIISIVKGKSSYTITIKTDTEGAQIFYTLDGKEPSEANSKSIIYKAAFNVTNLNSIKAIAVCDNYLDSEIVEKSYSIVASGACGKNITWQLDSDGVLALSGKGDMHTYESIENLPWYAHREKIYTVMYTGEITSISGNAFRDCVNLTKVSLTDSIIRIGAYAFENTAITGIILPKSLITIGECAFKNTNLSELIIPNSVTTILEEAFGGCIKLSQLYIPNTVTEMGVNAFSVTTAIIGYVGSMAETYANVYGNPFIDIEDVLVTVTFETFTDTIVMEPQKYWPGEYIVKPEMERVGYRFLGWYKTPDQYIPSNEWIFEENVITEDITLYAGWEAKGYLLYFDGNYEGAESIPVGWVTFDQKYSELPIPVREGYTFSGWYTEREGGTLITEDSIYCTPEYITLYAHWTPNVYEVTLEPGEGILNDLKMNVTFDSAYGELPIPVREMYTFVGWYTQQDGGVLVTQESFVTISENHTLYARYELPIIASGTYKEGNWKLDALGRMTVSGYAGVKYNIPSQYRVATLELIIEDGITEIGDCAFEGFEKIEKVRIPESVVSVGTQAFAGCIALKEVTFPRKLENIGEQAFRDCGNLPLVYIPYAVKNVGDLAFTNTVIIKGFCGSTAHTYAIEHGNSFIDITEDAIEVSFVTNCEMEVEWQYYLEASLAEEPDDLGRIGYTFGGWYTSTVTQDESTRWDFGQNIVKDDITLYAMWVPNTYKVTLNATNGIMGDLKEFEKEVVYDASYGGLPIPVRIGSRFVCWCLEDGMIITEETIVNTAEDHTLYARWEYSVAALEANPLSGEVEAGTRVAITTETNGAKIYYTTNNELDLRASAANGTLETDAELYEDKIEITEAVTIYAIAVKEGYGNSDILTVSYTVKDESQEWGEITEEDRMQFADANAVPKELWLTGVADCDYTGTAITFPDMNVYSYKTLLTLNKDYTVKYKNNTKVGTATITITGKGNYAGAIVKIFTIRPLDLSNATVEDVVTTYNGKVRKSTTTVRYLLGDKTVTLKAGKDFTYTYPGTTKGKDDYDANAFKAANTYEVILTGKGNYTGTTSYIQTITEKYVIGKMSLSSIASQKYTGAAIEPELVLKRGKIKLVKDADYTVEFSNNVNVGTASVTITGIGDYTGTRTATFKITGTALSKVKLSGFKSSFAWAGKVITQDVIFSYNTKVGKETISNYLVEGEDYTVTYQNNKEIGTATVIYTGINGYTGTVKKTYKITGISMNKVVVKNLTSSMVYDGKEMLQSKYELTYTTGKGEAATTDVLVEGEDFIVSYKNHAKVGTATISFKGINQYSGTLNKTYKITAYKLSGDKITVSDILDQTYLKGGVAVKPIVTFTNEERTTVLVEGKDYTLKYSNHNLVADKTAKSAPIVTITGKGNFSGTVSKKFTIVGSDLSVTSMTATNVTYQKKANICKPMIAVYDTNGKKLAAGTDYNKTITYTYAKDVEVTQIVNKKTVSLVRFQGDTVNKNDIIPVGAEIIATVTGIKNYSGTQLVKFRYVTADIAKATVAVKAQVYTGKAVEPTKDDIVVKIGKTVLEATDYEIVSYSNNVSKGTGKMVIRGVGNYGGTKNVTFKINTKTMNYTIFYDKNADDVTGTMKNSSISSGKALTANVYKRSGYQFKGWNTRPDGMGISYSNKEKFHLKDSLNLYGTTVRLYAQWTPIE